MSMPESVQRFELVFDLLQRGFQSRAPVGVRGALIQDVLPLHLQIAASALPRRIFGCRFPLTSRVLRHLLFHRFAFPTARHASMLRCAALLWS